MSHIRYFVHHQEARWSVLRDCKALGDFDAEAEALGAADQHAAIDRVRGHEVQVLKRDDDGRWAPWGR